MNLENDDDWKMTKLELEWQTYGEFKDMYAGRVTFRNGKFESFTFLVRPDMAHDYMKLIAADVVRDASRLGDRLIASLGKTLGNDTKEKP